MPFAPQVIAFIITSKIVLETTDMGSGHLESLSITVNGPCHNGSKTFPPIAIVIRHIYTKIGLSLLVHILVHLLCDRVYEYEEEVPTQSRRLSLGSRQQALGRQAARALGALSINSGCFSAMIYRPPAKYDAPHDLHNLISHAVP